MWVWLDRIGPILFDAALSTAVFLSLVVLAILVCRQPSRRRLIARVALLASLAMIPLVALAPLPRLDLVDTLVQSNLLPPSVIVDPDQINPPAPQAAASEHPTRWRITKYLPDHVVRGGRWLPRSLALADLACVATGVAWLLLGFWGVRWLIRHSREPSAATRQLYDRLFAGQPNGRARPDLRVSSRVQHPVVFGMLNPTILIPPSYDEPDNEADAELLRLSLLHEIVHAEESDPWFGTVASLAQTIWFFLPQIWWIRSQLLIDQEFLADRSAALRYGTTSGYAASLLALAESGPCSSMVARPSGPGAGWLAGGKDARSPLFQRMRMLLYCPFRVEARAPRSWSWTLRVTVIAASIVAACVCIRWPDARALENRLKGESAPASEPFRVTDFVAEPLVFLPGGRALPYMMPVALPSRFELSVEVLARSSDLAKVHIAGHPLGLVHPSTDLADQTPSAPDLAESWHQVRLERHGLELSLRVDGRKIPASLKPEANSEWLTFEPGPERPSHFRNLVVTW
ncbi:MAG: M56 family metallopeptidase [Isosphaerales bacterium]